METKIKIGDIYDKNINFLLGSGASYGFLPTLALQIKSEGDNTHTIETLSTLWEREEKLELRTLLFNYYYTNCIKPAIDIDMENLCSEQKKVFDNYATFLRTVLLTISRSQSSGRKCNIFTTNYDGCVEIAADNLIEDEKLDFILNDGCRGFIKRYLHSKNFNTVQYKTGVFGKHRSGISQLNLIHLHGSIFWGKTEDRITVDYNNLGRNHILSDRCMADINDFSRVVNNGEAGMNAFDKIDTSNVPLDEFWSGYNQLPIVNPTKWKFYETVFEEHYYQMLRYMSYELEKENSVLIAFGFSFADEHIRHLVQRSLSNPSLQVYVCCFNDEELQSIDGYFSEYNNVVKIRVDGVLDFDAFNSEVFTLNPSGSEEENPGEEE